MVITSFFAALSGIIFIGLSVIVIIMRNKYKVALGDNPQADLQKYIRSHANFAEYTPLFLILLGLLENAELSGIFLLALGSIFLIARISHAYGLMCAEKMIENKPSNITFRVIGMMGTFGSIITASMLLMLFSVSLIA